MIETYRKFCNNYEVSDAGNVRRIGCETPLKPSVNIYRNNYCSVALSEGGKVRSGVKVHQIVAFAFPEICGEWFEGAEVDHIDGNPMNNAASNLRWVDKKDNMANPITKEKQAKKWTPELRAFYSERMKGDNNPAKNMDDEWRKNISEALKGKPNTGCWKKVACYTTDGKLVAIYDSIMGASEQTGIKLSAISNTANGRQNTGGGYIWKHC